jgi:hypothetical protein
MAVRVICPRCNQASSLPENLRGKTVRCRHCQHTFVGPREDSEDDPDTTEEARKRQGMRTRPVDRTVSPPDEPRERPARRAKSPADETRKSSAVGILVTLLILGFFVLLIGGGVTLLTWSVGPVPDTETPAAQVPVNRVASPPPFPPGGPVATGSRGEAPGLYTTEYVPTPDMTLTLPQWFHERPVDLPPDLQNQLQPNRHQGLLAPESSFWTNLGRQVRAREFRKSGLIPRSSGKIYVEDYPAEGGLLIGFFLAKDGFVPYVQPIYLTRDREVVGRAYGKPTANAVCFKAKPGYSVGGMYVHSGDLLNAVALTYQRVTPTGLDRNDWYQSGWVGSEGGTAGIVGHDGSFIVGVHGKVLDFDYITPRGGMTTIGTIALR